MKKTQCWLLLSLILTTSFYAQNEIDCNTNLKNALSYLQGTSTVAKDSLKAIEYLKPCLRENNPNAQLIMGHLFLKSVDESNLKKGFQLIKKAANQNHAGAIENLGVLYKYGIGCKLNYNKARNYFIKGAKLGNHKAAYSLGYLYLKGLGNINQDYSEAVKWFKKSEYPMAKHWLGVCYLKGYGVPRDLIKANELLGNNYEKAQLNINTQNENISLTSNLKNTKRENDEYNSILLKEINLYGKWKGQLLQLDWSGNEIENHIPLAIEFRYNQDLSKLQYIWKVNNEEKAGNLIYTEDAIYFEDLYTNLPHTSYHITEPDLLENQILSSELVLKNIEENNYLIGKVDGYIPKWNEPSIPMRIVLIKEKSVSDNAIEISDTVLQTLAMQEDSFIKLFPNPFENDLIIAYSLSETSSIEIHLVSFDGLKKYTLEQGKQQLAGEYKYHFEGTKLQKGLYVINIIVNGLKKSKIILKK